MYDDMVDMLQVRYAYRNDAHCVSMYDDILLLVQQDDDILVDGTEVDAEELVVILKRGFMRNEVEVEQMLDITEIHYAIDL